MFRRKPAQPDPLPDIARELEHVCVRLEALHADAALLRETLAALRETIGLAATTLRRVDGRLDALERWADDNSALLARAGAAPYPHDRSRHIVSPGVVIPRQGEAP